MLSKFGRWYLEAPIWKKCVTTYPFFFAISFAFVKLTGWFA